MAKHIASAVAFFILLIFLFVLEMWVVGIVQTNKYVAENWIKERHKYHGIQTSFEERGKHYFIDKKGRKCRL